jgi:hypothetical protein
MIYKLLTTEDGIKIYARIDEDGLCRVTCTEQNPEFMAWVAEGNLPSPADIVEPSQASVTPLPADE